MLQNLEVLEYYRNTATNLTILGKFLLQKVTLLLSQIDTDTTNRVMFLPIGPLLVQSKLQNKEMIAKQSLA